MTRDENENGNKAGSDSPVLWNATAHALGCGMNNGRPVLACVCGLPNKQINTPCSEDAAGSEDPGVGESGECCNTMTPTRFPSPNDLSACAGPVSAANEG